MKRMRSSWGRAVIVASAVMWVLGLTAQQVHRIVTLHVRCAEHGGIVELRLEGEGPATRSFGAPGVDRIQAYPLPSSHDHGCPLHAAIQSQVPPGQRPLPVPAPGIQVLTIAPDVGQVYAGRPLAYAPKTSPPA